MADLFTHSIHDTVAFGEMERTRRIRSAWMAYDGEHPKPLKVDRDRPDDNLRVNLCKRVVNKGVAFLFGKSIDFELDDASGSEPAAEWLQVVWRRNRKQSLLKRYALNGAVCGHAFMRLLVTLDPMGRVHPRLVNLDPATVTVKTKPDDHEEVLAYKVQFTSIEDSGKAVAFRQLIERNENGRSWTITDQKSEGSSTAFTTIAIEEWRYEWPPIIGNQNLPRANEHWGMSDLESDVVNLNFGINKLVSNAMRVVRLHAHPKPWIAGMSADQAKMIDFGTDRLLKLQGSKDQVAIGQLEMTHDLSATVQLLAELKAAFHGQTRVPDLNPELLSRIGNLSGVALELLHSDLLELTEDKRVEYGEMLIELNRRMLELGGFGPDLQTVIHWPELLPADPVAESQAALIDQTLGVSRDTLLTRRGFDPDLERTKKQTETSELGEALLTTFDQGGD